MVNIDLESVIYNYRELYKDVRYNIKELLYLLSTIKEKKRKRLYKEIMVEFQKIELLLDYPPVEDFVKDLYGIQYLTDLQKKVDHTSGNCSFYIWDVYLGDTRIGKQILSLLDSLSKNYDATIFYLRLIHDIKEYYGPLLIKK